MGKPKAYILDMFPYPSGAGLHVGHPEGYTATDILCRYKRMRGYHVLHPMGWDAFGLPAEQYAIETGTHPRITTQKNIDTFRRQIKSLGFSYDWDREVDTTDPHYVKWTQWIFLQIYDTWYDHDRQEGPADRRTADPAENRSAGRRCRPPLSGQQAPGLPGRGAGQLVPGLGHGAGQRRSHRRQIGARRPSGRPHAAAPVDAAHHRLRRAPDRRSGAARLVRIDQGDAAATGSARAKGPRSSSISRRRR